MKNSIISICLYSFSVINCLAQNKTVSSLHSVASQNNTNHYEERIYLHINSPFLLVGESLLFKTYSVNSTNNTPSTLSTIAYVEVIDATASPVLQAKVLLKQGIGSGDFFLPSTLTSGNYTLIAYTHWMKNYSSENFFKKQITIINPFRKPENVTQRKKSQLQIEFFPEGGRIIAGVNNTIGFSVSDEKMNGIKFTGKVLDDTGNTIVEFSSANNGKARFSLTPITGKEYKAVIIDSLQNMHFQPLPLIVAEGIAMHVTEKENTFLIDLISRGIGKTAQAKIIVHQDDIFLGNFSIQFNNEQAQCEIKKVLLPFGISQLAVITTNNEVACERFVFNAPTNESGLDLILKTKTYNTRQKISATLTTKDTLPSHLSISVRKIEKKASNPVSITRNLFFDDEKSNLNYSNKNSIDDEMLARKPMPYSVENLLTSRLSTPQFLPEVRNNLITGIVRRKDSTPAAKEKVYLSIPSKEYLFFASITDSTGRFYFNTDKIKFNTDVILQVAPATCPDCQIKLDGNGLNDYKNFVPAPLEIDSSFQKIIEQRSVFAQIENAYYLQKQDSIVDTPETVRFYGQPDKTYLLDDYVRFPTMEDILIEYVLEIILKKKGDQFEIRVMNLRKREAFSEDPLILLDGIPVFDINQLMGYNPLLLKKIEIVGRRYFYGPIETQGIISFTTYDGTGNNVPVAQKEKYLGILTEKLYFSPVYDEVSQLTTIPDYRTQLYWNPIISLSEKPQTFEFYTSDVTGDFEIVIEGIRVDGQPLHHREVIHIDAK
ncbi:MAG: hypothetical protein ABI663_22565 [Chryseolinea sp.]